MNFKSLAAILILGALSSAAPHRRQAGGVITSCSVPNTAALTFVSGDLPLNL